MQNKQETKLYSSESDVYKEVSTAFQFIQKQHLKHADNTFYVTVDFVFFHRQRRGYPQKLFLFSESQVNPN